MRLLAGVLTTALLSCGTASNAPAPTDGGREEAGVSRIADASPTPRPELPDGARARCKLSGDADPVSLCHQKAVLGAWFRSGYREGAGTSLTWDPETGLPGGAHAVEADLALAAAIASYARSAGRYGDNELEVEASAVLRVLADRVVADASGVSGYDGELYLELRAVSGALRHADDKARAKSVDDVADHFVRSMMSEHISRTLGRNVLGDADETGQVSYAPKKVAAAALALLEFAERVFFEEPEVSGRAAAHAATMLTDLVARARTAGGLFPSLLRASADHKDEVLTAEVALDTQSRVLLSLLRASAFLRASKHLAKEVRELPCARWGRDLLEALQRAPSFWDASRGAYVRGFHGASPLSSLAVTPNAELYASLHRASVDGLTDLAVTQLAPLRRTLVQGRPLHTGFFSARAEQQGYPLLVKDDFTMEEGDPYEVFATVSVIVSLNEAWYGLGE